MRGIGLFALFIIFQTSILSGNNLSSCGFDELYDLWVKESIKEQVKGYHGGLRNYLFNTRFDEIVELGEPALPFIKQKIHNYLDQVGTYHEFDIYLVYAALAIKEWKSEDFVEDEKSPGIRIRSLALEVVQKLDEGK